jgi:GT2 family glycosyltransferase
VTRPTVSVVMPFAGDAAAAAAAIGALSALVTRPGDELILADNSSTGFGSAADSSLAVAGIEVVHAGAEHSPAHARNAGAEEARGEWVLFLDSDCRAPGGLLDAYFELPVDSQVGALAGEVAPELTGPTLASRYGASRGFLSQEAHLAHPYLPRAVAANLLVRRAAFEQIGGFYEGVRAAEDTDFSWRLQKAGWRLELRPGARVEHRYRATLGELRRQWRGYAAGRAWLGRRYDGFTPQPAVARARGRALSSLRGVRPLSRMHPTAGRRPGGGRPVGGTGVALVPAAPVPRGRIEAVRHLAIDGLLAAEELVGLALSNRPTRPPTTGPAPPVRVVLIAERFPARADPLVDFARRLEQARVEAAARPESVNLQAARSLVVDYREDEGAAARLVSLASLVLRHPFRCVRDLAGRSLGDPSLASLAPAVRRLHPDGDARLHALGPGRPQRTAARLASLSGRPLDPRPR